MKDSEILVKANSFLGSSWLSAEKYSYLMIRGRWGAGFFSIRTHNLMRYGKK